MQFVTHDLADLPAPPERAWVDGSLALIRDRMIPVGAVVSRDLDSSGGCALALYDGDAPEEPSARTYELTDVREGKGTGPARYLQLTVFDGPRTAEWVAAYDRAGHERIWPAVQDTPGFVRMLGGRATDGGCFTAVLAESVEALQEGVDRIMATQLLPREDASMLTGPDRVLIQQVMHLDLPVDSLSVGVGR
jgi:hypothetical protein